MCQGRYLDHRIANIEIMYVSSTNIIHYLWSVNGIWNSRKMLSFLFSFGQGDIICEI